MPTPSETDIRRYQTYMRMIRSDTTSAPEREGARKRARKLRDKYPDLFEHVAKAKVAEQSRAQAKKAQFDASASIRRASIMLPIAWKNRDYAEVRSWLLELAIVPVFHVGLAFARWFRQAPRTYQVAAGLTGFTGLVFHPFYFHGQFWAYFKMLLFG